MRILLAITMLMLCLQSSAQNNCNLTPFNCNANLVNALYDSADITILTNVSYAKEGIASAKTLSDINYPKQCSSNQTCDYSGKALKYDVYFPASHDFNSCPLPVIFLFHPGNYSECSNTEGAAHYAMLFAQRGFVAVNIEYRRGTLEDPSYKVSASKMLAVYRGTQDLRGAIRSLIARQYDGTAGGFLIDTSNIFLGDAGTTPLSVAYMVTQEAFDETAPGVSAVLGPLNNNNYYGSKDISFKVKGVFNESGGLLMGASKKARDLLLTQNLNPIPALISFHGELDNLILPEIKSQFYSVSSTYKSETFCLNNKTYTVPATKYPSPDVLFAGSSSLYKTLSGKGVPCELYLDSKMQHELASTSGFGTGNTDPYVVQEYIAQRVATFFQAVINGKANELKTKIFRDCENFRYGCNMADNNNSCPVKNIQQSNITATADLFTMKMINKMVYITLNKAIAAHAEVYDYTGNRIKQASAVNKEITIDLSGRKSGVYIIKVTQEKFVQSKNIFLN